MKRSATMCGAAAVLVSALLLAGCGQSNDFGVSVDLTEICAYLQGTATGSCVSNPEVSLAANQPLFADLRVANRMSTTSGSASGQTVRLVSLEVFYRAPTGNAIPSRRQQLARNVNPGETVTLPATLLSYEQIEYLKDNPALFPDYPFQINLRVRLVYNTTGAAEGEVERLFSLEAVR